MRPGETVVIRESNEPAEVVAILDAAGTLLLRVGDETFESAPESCMSLREKHADCGCCG